MKFPYAFDVAQSRLDAGLTALDDAVPDEIFLDAEQAARHRLSVKHHANTRTIPQLRLIGYTLLALLGVPLHNIFITHSFSFNAFFTYLIVVELYSTASWLLLFTYYERIKAFDLGDVFLYVDLLFWAGAVYVTGGEKSWFFWVPLLRVADQSVWGFKRTLSFVGASTGIFLGLWLYLLFVEHRVFDVNTEIAKTAFVAVAGFYIALTSRATARVRSKLVSTIRFARHAITELKVRGGELVEARARAEHASQAKSEFLARVSQELRRPATSVIGFAQLLEMGDLSQKQRDYASRILRSGQDLGILLDEIMDLADLQSGFVKLEPTEIDLPDLIEETLAHVWPLAAARGVRLIATDDPSGNDMSVWADARALRRALLNTIAHVVRYSGPDDRVVLSWKRHGEQARISVRDSGPGILSEPVEELLASSPRPDDITRIQQLGLGLVFSKALVQAMHGSVGADLEIGQGTTYWLELPLSETASAGARPLTPLAGRG